MGRVLRTITNGGFVMSTRPMIMLGMLVLSISIMSLIVFACTESSKKREKKLAKKKRDKKSDKKKRDKKSSKKKHQVDVDYSGCFGCCCEGGHADGGGDGGGGDGGGGGCGGGGGGGGCGGGGGGG